LGGVDLVFGSLWCIALICVLYLHIQLGFNQYIVNKDVLM